MTLLINRYNELTKCFVLIFYFILGNFLYVTFPTNNYNEFSMNNNESV